MRRTPIALLAAVALSGGVVMTGTPALADPVGQITEYSIPTPGSFPTEDITGPDGNIWFTENVGNAIGKVTTTGTFTEFPLSTINSQPLAIATGPDGNLWFTETRADRIGRISTAGVITEFSVTASSQPDDITAGPDGNLWFSEQGANNIARITPAGVITEFPVPTAGGLAAGSGIGAGPDGNLWFTEGSGNKIGRITPTGVISEFPVPTGGSRPNKIEPGQGVDMWFTEYNADKIGRFTVGAPNAITEYPVPTPSAGPNDLRAGPDGNMWFTEYTFGVDRVAQISAMSGLITEFKVPTANSQPGGIALGPDGNMWFTEDNASKIARIGTQGGLPGGSVLFARDTRLDTIDVSTDSVPYNMTFPSDAPCASQARPPRPGGQSGCRNWDFQMLLPLGTGGASSLTGAQVAVDSTSTGLALNNPSLFNFTYSTVQNGPGAPPQPTACPTPTLHQETCPVPGSTISANGGLDVSSFMDPQSGVPIGPVTTGYDSARQLSPPVNGIAAVAVPITLRDSSRFAGNSNDIGMGTFNSNVVPLSGSITDSNGAPLPLCQPPGSGQASTTCAEPPNYNSCQITRCNPGQVCTSAFFHVRFAQLDQTYSFKFQQYVGNSTNPATGNCGSVKTALRIDVSPGTPPPGSTPCCSATLNDPTLGNVTFSIDPGQTAEFQAEVRADYVVQYGSPPPLQVMMQLHPIEGQSINGQVGGFFDPGESAPAASDFSATIDWGDGSSSPGVISGPDVNGFFAVSGSHQYADEGGGQPTLTVTDLDTPGNTGSASGEPVRDAQLFPQTGPDLRRDLSRDQQPGGQLPRRQSGGDVCRLQWDGPWPERHHARLYQRPLGRLDHDGRQLLRERRRQLHRDDQQSSRGPRTAHRQGHDPG